MHRPLVFGDESSHFLRLSVGLASEPAQIFFGGWIGKPLLLGIRVPLVIVKLRVERFLIVVKVPSNHSGIRRSHGIARTLRGNTPDESQSEQGCANCG